MTEKGQLSNDTIPYKVSGHELLQIWYGLILDNRASLKIVRVGQNSRAKVGQFWVAINNIKYPIRQKLSPVLDR